MSVRLKAHLKLVNGLVINSCSNFDLSSRGNAEKSLKETLYYLKQFKKENRDLRMLDRRNF